MRCSSCERVALFRLGALYACRTHRFQLLVACAREVKARDEGTKEHETWRRKVDNYLLGHAQFARLRRSRPGR